ncbi:uncharacterized protein LOC130807685 [Amaranthus tricolor]|uniref:uncharacterized protein LOC130807685 n=1 Tax=Amaranthus tricolor TaxID=29722 RepID=UPI00258C3BA4|nr:uncharacterized protein LOC130807685 [Amaranthus tricolor]
MYFVELLRAKSIKLSMDERKELPKAIASTQNLKKEEAQKEGEARANMGQTGSLMSPLKKSSSSRINCLCSPTTHVGSFRCRLHRHGNKSGFRRGHSVGSDLSELAHKSSPSTSSLQLH